MARKPKSKKPSKNKSTAATSKRRRRKTTAPKTATKRRRRKGGPQMPYGPGHPLWIANMRRGRGRVRLSAVDKAIARHKRRSSRKKSFASKMATVSMPVAAPMGMNQALKDRLLGDTGLRARLADFKVRQAQKEAEQAIEDARMAAEQADARAEAAEKALARHQRRHAA